MEDFKKWDEEASKKKNREWRCMTPQSKPSKKPIDTPLKKLESRVEVKDT